MTKKTILKKRPQISPFCVILFSCYMNPENHAYRLKTDYKVSSISGKTIKILQGAGENGK